MSLENEIREVLYSAKCPLHPEVIRMQVLAGRREGGFKQELDTFKRVMRSMEDIEKVKVKGRWYRQFKADGKHSFGYHLHGIMSLVITRVGSWKITPLLMKLEDVKKLTVERLQRLIR